MKSLIFIILITSSCALKEKQQVLQAQGPVSVEVALQLARTGYIRSCIKAHKEHAPKKNGHITAD